MMVDADDMREASSRSWGDLAWSSFFRHWTRMCMGMHWGRCGWMASSSRFGLVWFDLLLLSQVEILILRSCFPVPVSTPNPSISISIFYLYFYLPSLIDLSLQMDTLAGDVERCQAWKLVVLVGVGQRRYRRHELSICKTIVRALGEAG